MGGGTMRTIARVVGVGAVRGSSVMPRTEQPVGVLKPSRPASTSSVSSIGDGDKGKVVTSSQGKTDPSVARRSSWDIDDWEFAESDLFEQEIPPARIIFGPPPTRQEALEATSDLKETLKKMSFAPPADGNAAPHAVETSNASDELILNEAETKLCVASGHAIIAPSMHNNVLQAFSLLNERPDIQNMVASLAADRHIWEAVLNNEKVLEFCQSNGASFSSKDAAPSVSVSENFGADVAISNGPGGGFWTFMSDMKLRMSEFISKVSEVALSFIGLSPKESSKDANNDFVETAVRASFMLAVVVIFVVVLKRVP